MTEGRVSIRKKSDFLFNLYWEYTILGIRETLDSKRLIVKHWGRVLRDLLNVFTDPSFKVQERVSFVSHLSWRSERAHENFFHRYHSQLLYFMLNGCTLVFAGAKL